MGETANVAEMAKLASTMLFDGLNWHQRGPVDLQWPCEKTDAHKSKSNSHPTDIVFKYMDPYEGENTYLQFDLKSYGKGSITAPKLRPALVSLSEQVACASISQTWQEQYLDEGDSAVVHGVLFIYNHDGEYDKDFRDAIRNTRSNQLVHPRGSKLFVLGPGDIVWGINIVDQIKRCRGDAKFNGGPIRFFLPQLARKTLRGYQAERTALPIESLLSDHVTITYTDKNSQQDYYHVYYRGGCDSSEEFVFLLNYLIQYQVINGMNKVEIIGIGVPDNAITYFNKACNYLVRFLNDNKDVSDSELSKTLAAVEFANASAIRTHFSQLEIGFNRA